MNNKRACEQRLRRGLAVMKIPLEDERIQRLLRYLAEFDRWNRVYNLSAVRDPLAMVERHLLDSLALVPHLAPLITDPCHFGGDGLVSGVKRVIDVGTGGGLPGIPLAIAFPDTDFVLLDSNGKKTRFLFHIKTLLGLANVTLEKRRVQEYQPPVLFDIVVSRAFAGLQTMVLNTRHLLAGRGRFWAMKGVYPENELRDCAKHAIVESAVGLTIPDQQAERHLLILTPVDTDPFTK